MSTTTIGGFTTWNGTPEELHEHNTQYLRNVMQIVIEEIKQRSRGLNNDIIDEWTGLDEVQSLYNSIINNYTIQIANSSHNESYIRTNIDRFNKKVLVIKKHIQELLIEQELVKEELLLFQKNIEEELQKICLKYEINAQYVDIQKICVEISKINQINSNRKKLQSFNEIKTKCNLLSEIIRIQLSVDSIIKELIDSSLIAHDDPIIQKYQSEYSSLINQPIANQRFSLVKGLLAELEFLLEAKQKEAKEIESRMKKLEEVIEKIRSRELIGRNSQEFSQLMEKFIKIQEIKIPSLRVPVIEEIATSYNRLSQDVLIAELIGSVGAIDLPPRPKNTDEILKLKIEQEKTKIYETTSRIFNRMKKIDQDESLKYSSFIDEIMKKNLENVNIERIRAIDNQIQTGYIHLIRKVADSIIIKADLDKIIAQLSSEGTSEILEIATQLKEEKYPDMQEYDKLSQRFLDYQIQLKAEEDKRKATSEALHQITQQLEQLGYSISTYSKSNENLVGSLLEKKPIYYNTNVNGYAIMLQMNQSGKLVIKFYRVVASEKDKITITNESLNLGKEEAKKWCKNYDKIKKILNQKGTKFIENTRIEPQTNLETKVIPELVAVEEEKKPISIGSRRLSEEKFD